MLESQCNGARIDPPITTEQGLRVLSMIILKSPPKSTLYKRARALRELVIIGNPGRARPKSA